MESRLMKMMLTSVALTFALACGGELPDEEVAGADDLEVGQSTQAITNSDPRVAKCLPLINSGVARYSSSAYDVDGINNGLYCEETRPTLMWSRPVMKYFFKPRPTYEISRTYLNGNLGYVTHNTNLLPYKHLLTQPYGDYQIVGKAHKAMLLRKKLQNGCWRVRMLFVDPLGRLSSNKPIGDQTTGMCGVKPTGLSSFPDNAGLELQYAVLWSYPKPVDSGKRRAAVWLLSATGQPYDSFDIRAHSSVAASLEARSLIMEGLSTRYDDKDNFTRLLWTDGTSNFTMQTYRPADCLGWGQTSRVRYCRSYVTFGVTTNGQLPSGYANQGWGVHSMLDVGDSLSRLVLSRPGQARFLRIGKDGNWVIVGQTDPVWNTGDTGLTFIGAHFRKPRPKSTGNFNVISGR